MKLRDAMTRIKRLSTDIDRVEGLSTIFNAVPIGLADFSISTLLEERDKLSAEKARLHTLIMTSIPSMSENRSQADELDEKIRFLAKLCKENATMMALGGESKPINPSISTEELMEMIRKASDDKEILEHEWEQFLDDTEIALVSQTEETTV